MVTGGFWPRPGPARTALQLPVQFRHSHPAASRPPSPPGRSGVKPKRRRKVHFMGLDIFGVDPPGQVKDKQVHLVPEGVVDVDQVPEIVPGNGGQRGDQGQGAALGPAGLMHCGQAGLDIGKVVGPAHPRAGLRCAGLASGPSMEICRRNMGARTRRSAMAAIRVPLVAMSSRQPQAGGRFDEVQRALVEHGFAAPEVDEGVVAVAPPGRPGLPGSAPGRLHSASSSRRFLPCRNPWSPHWPQVWQRRLQRSVMRKLSWRIFRARPESGPAIEQVEEPLLALAEWPICRRSRDVSPAGGNFSAPLPRQSYCVRP